MIYLATLKEQKLKEIGQMMAEKGFKISYVERDVENIKTNKIEHEITLFGWSSKNYITIALTPLDSEYESIPDKVVFAGGAFKTDDKFYEVIATSIIRGYAFGRALYKDAYHYKLELAKVPKGLYGEDILFKEITAWLDFYTTEEENKNK